jgi:2-polyprenyl-3-methyl-5-hydroxy-6-metoxy-1,4-benzoquinol methylase
MNHWKPTETYRKIAEANRTYYSQTAGLYDATETCVQDEEVQGQLEADIDRVLGALNKPVREVSALDACGGSGNISMKLLRRGVNVVLADISPQLLELFEKKAAAAGYPAKSVCSEVATFLGDSVRAFDLIVFSSALHHLENIDGVLGLAYQRLAPGGLLFTVFDPTAQSQRKLATRMLLKLDYYWFKLVCQSSDVLPAAGRRFRRLLSGSTPDRKDQVALNQSTVGMLAEYHVERGIDDLGLVERLKGVGYEVVWHERYAKCRANWMLPLVQFLGDKTSFKLLLRKPHSARLAK